MGPIKPEDFSGGFEREKTGPDGSSEKTRASVSFATEDIIAGFAGLVAVLFLAGMLMDKIPVNPLTVGVLGFSGAGAVAAKIIQAKRGRK